MKKIERSDILEIDSYEKIRPEFRQRMMGLKEPRRISVGPYLTFIFENTQTMIYQVQEMMRVEKIREESAIHHEIETYNQLVPGENELSATLFLEFDDPTVRRVKLEELVGLEDHTFLLIDRDYQIQAQFDEKQKDERKLSSVQYIKFPLTEKARDAILTSPYVEILTTHPACSYRQALRADQIEALRQDLA